MVNKNRLLGIGLATVASVAGVFGSVKASAEMAAAATVKTPSYYLAVAWDRTYYEPFLSSLASASNQQAATPEEQVKCDRFYSRVKQKGEMKLIMGIGYYDFSEGEPFNFDYYQDGGYTLQHEAFGMNATIDITYDIMYRKILTAPCRGNLELCGFTEESKGVYAKQVRTPSGEKIRAVVEIKNSSVTPSHATNIGPMLADQTAKSAETTNWFFGSIKDADFVVYNGHSRKGGGPDFNPPKLLKSLHVNYGWYQKNQPGLKNLLNGLKAAQQPSGLMLMSCNSAALFEKSIAKSAPMTSFMGTNAIIPGDIPNKGAMAGLDSFLRFQCQDGFNKALSMDADMTAQLKPMKIH